PAPVVKTSTEVLGLTLTRRVRDFTERDRLVLNLLQPHLRQAYKNAELLQARAQTPDAIEERGRHAFGFTRRESDVACWLAEGKTNAEIAVILGVSARTVEKHM